MTVSTAIRKRKRRRPLRRAVRRLGLYGWLVMLIVAYTAVRWLVERPLIAASAVFAVVTWSAVWIAWRRGPSRMTPDRFEQHVAGLLQRDGCTDVQVIGGANDLGADVIATSPDGLRVVVQCKRYTKRPVGSPELQTFGGTARPVHRAHIACMVTTSRFTKPAVDYAASMGIQLIDGRALQSWRAGTMPAPWA